MCRMVDAGLFYPPEREVYVSLAVLSGHLLPLRPALARQPARSVQEQLAELPCAGVISHTYAELSVTTQSAQPRAPRPSPGSTCRFCDRTGECPRCFQRSR